MEWMSAQLRALVELTRRGTVTAVAQAFGYTPGSASQQLNSPERAAEVQLNAFAAHAEQMQGIERPDRAFCLIWQEVSHPKRSKDTSGRCVGFSLGENPAGMVAEPLPLPSERKGLTDSPSALGGQRDQKGRRRKIARGR